jgi:hypothetical protein
MMKFKQKVDCELDFPRFSYGYQKCMFVDSLTENIGPSECILYYVH